MCQVYTGAYVSLLAPGQIDYTACHPGKTITYTTYIIVVCCCYSHINSHNQARGHRTGSSHSGAEEYLTQTSQRWYTRVSQLTQFMPPPETYKKVNRESAYDMPGPYWCIRLTTRAWKNRLYRLPPKEDYHVYIARSTYHYAYARQTQVNWKKRNKEKTRQEDKRKEESEIRKREGKKGKTRNARKDKTKRESKGRRRKKCHTSRPY